MSQISLSKWLKGILLGIAFCGIIIYFFLIPTFGKDLVDANPEFAYCYQPWMIAILLSAIPCYLVLYLGWQITSEIAKDNSFSLKNAKYLKYISIMALLDSGFVFLVNLIFLLLNMNHPSILIGCLFLEFAGVAVAVVAAALSHLVQKAAEIQMENELTI